MKKGRLTIYCEKCLIGFDINFRPCVGLEVMKCVPCPQCSLEHTVIIRVDVEAEIEWKTIEPKWRAA